MRVRGRSFRVAKELRGFGGGGGSSLSSLEGDGERRRFRTRAKAKGKGLNPLKRLFGAASGKGTVRARVAERERNLTGAPEIELPLGEVAGDIQGEGEGGVLKEGEHPLLNWNLEEMKKKEGLGFGFSAGGLLFPYFVGNAVALKRLGLITEDTVFAGSSAGSLISAFLVCGLDPEMLMGANIEMYRELRSKGTVGQVRDVVETYAHAVLPPDAHLKAKGRLNVSVVRVNKWHSPFLQPVYVNEFHSKDDLVQALLTSSHVPLYMDTKMTSTYRGRTCVDGGLGTNFIPVPPCTEPVTVCCFPNMPFESDIAPGKYSACDHSLRKMLQFALLPPSEDKIVELFELGVNDVLDWATQITRPEDLL